MLNRFTYSVVEVAVSHLVSRSIDEVNWKVVNEEFRQWPPGSVVEDILDPLAVLVCSGGGDCIFHACGVHMEVGYSIHTNRILD